MQAEGCAPIVRAFAEGGDERPAVANAHTIADGLRVPRAIGDFLMLRAIRESGGTALAVSRCGDGGRDARDWAGWKASAPRRKAAPRCGARRSWSRTGTIEPRRVVVLFNTGGALKYLDVLDVEMSVSLINVSIANRHASRQSPNDIRRRAV